MQKTYYKTASLISNSCKAIALLAGQTTEVAMLAFEYGKNLVCDFILSFFLFFSFFVFFWGTLLFVPSCVFAGVDRLMDFMISGQIFSFWLSFSWLIPFCLWLFLFLYSNRFLFQGLAYQLIDDVLDFTGTSASLGKGSLSDIRHVILLSLL